MQGRIINHISNTYQIEVEQQIFQAVAKGKIKIQQITPMVGDQVEFEIIEKEKRTARITKVLPRKNELKRPKIANLTKLVFVISCHMPKLDLLLLDKQLVFSAFLKIPSIIVINKSDLASQEEIQKIKQIYTKIGYLVLVTNAKENIGIEELKKELIGEVCAFSGHSGVGKSTLLNAILNRKQTQEGELSKKSQKGKNTTTSIQLYQIEKNTYIADTPGFSTFDIYELESKSLYQYFIEFPYYEKNCQFVGCTHIKEDVCGIKQAWQEGKIDATRYEHYVKIYKNIKEKEEHRW